MRQPKCECRECRYCKKRSEYLRNRSEYILRSQIYQKNNKDKVNAKNSRWKRENREKVNQSHKNRRVRHKESGSSVMVDKDRRSDLMKYYGVTPQWWDAKFEEQNKSCGICGCTENNASNRRMHVDHSHTTGTNRGILCHRCNTALERLESVEDWAAKSTAYLEHYEKLYWDSVKSQYEKV